MKFPVLITLAFALIWANPSAADWTEARCDIYPKGQDHTDVMIPCTFSQRQGSITITRDDGVTHELSPSGDTPGDFKDQNNQTVYRQSGLGNQGLIFRFPDESVYVYWDTSALQPQNDDNLAAAVTTPADSVASSELAGTSWRLVKIMEMDDSVETPEDRSLYTLEFGADGHVAMRADCNRGSGTWGSEGPKQISFGPIAATRAMCPPGSLSDKYLAQFQWFRSYVMENGHLFLATMADGAIIEFEPVPAVSAGTQESDWVAKSNAYSMKVMEQQASFQPEGASINGLSQYDGQVMDLGPDFDTRQIVSSQALVEELKSSLAKESDPRVKQDIEILINSVEMGIEGAQLSQKYYLSWGDVPQIYFQSLSAILSEQSTPERYPKALERLQRYVGLYPGTTALTEQAKDRFEDSRGPDKIGPYRGEVESALAAFPTYAVGIRTLFEKYEIEGAGPALDALDQQIADYGEWTRTTVLPLTRDDFREPPELYAYMLKTRGIDLDPETLMAKARVEYYETRAAMQVLAPQVAAKFNFDSGDYRDVIRELKKDSIPDDELESTYREVNGKLEALIRENRVVTLPKSILQMRLSTAAEAASLPAPHMQGPPLIGNTGQQGIFILSISAPDAAPEDIINDYNFQAVTWTLSAHEARPGHELQFASMLEQGVSIARALYAFNSVNAEGWALYAEAEMVPYEPVEGQLIALQHRLLRAARAFLDPSLNLGLMDEDEARRILSEEVVLSPGVVKEQIERYTFRMPGQAGAYFYGYIRILDTRINAELALGDKFDRMAFNDFILSQGQLPPDLIDKAVREEFIPAQLARD